MKTSKRNKLLGLALVSSCSLFSANNALAAAGDSIANRATISFSVGGTAQTDIGSSPAGNTSGAGSDTTFLEDRVINFVVSEQDGATVNVAPSATLQVQRFQVQNTGNGVQDFLLLARNRTTGTNDPHSVSTDIFDVTAEQVFVDVNANGTYEPGTDTTVFIDELAAGATSEMIFIVSTIPDNVSVSNGDVAVMALVAQVAVGGAAATEGAAINNDNNNHVSPAGTYSNGGTAVLAGTANNVADDPTAVETVFNDPAGTSVDSTGAADAAQIGQTSADHSYTVQAAALTVTKTSAALWDPVNNASNPKSIPGGYVTYSVSIVNAAGAADAALTTLSDALPATLDLDPDFVTNVGPGNPTNVAGDGIEVTKGVTTIYCTGVADGDGCDYTGGAGGTITVDLSNATFAGIMPLAATETVTVNFNAIVQ